MQNQPTILAIEDDPTLARLYVEYLKNEPYAITVATNGQDGLAAFDKLQPAAVLLDLALPDIHGLEILRKLRAKAPDCLVLVVTATGSVNNAVEAMREGALDFIVKPFPAARLLVTLKNALERQKLDREVTALKGALDRESFCGFIGASPEMQAVYRLVESVAPSKASVFITGESGTGKEVAAEAVHRLSPRRERPFIALNCAAIPKDLLESELFGHLKGSFTGAVSDRVGAARAADGGTLFLDEIGEMPMELQVKMLRFIQTGTVQQIGSPKAEKVDVRFIAATNRDPMAEIEAGRFREDLFYRLHVVPIALPPLRERGDDVLLIAHALLAQYTAEENKGFTGFAPAAEALLRRYDWPGNVRQLQNVLRQAVVLNGGNLIDEAMLQLADTGRLPLGQRALPIPPLARTSTSESRLPVAVRPLWQVEKDAIISALKETNEDVPKAAALLEVSPSTIYRKLQSWREKESGN